jgi:hypothetical protein
MEKDNLRISLSNRKLQELEKNEEKFPILDFTIIYEDLNDIHLKVI